MIRQTAGLLTIILLGIIIIFGSIFCGCFFGIYYEFLRDYADATCTIQSSRSFPYSYYNDLFYTQFTLAISIEGQTYPAFACQANSNRYLTSTQQNPGIYAYSYVTCEQFTKNDQGYSVCDSSFQILPRWLCGSSNDVSKNSQTDTPCKYAISHTRQTNLKNVDLTSANYPKTDASYIQVIYDDSPWYPQGQFWAMMILNLGILVLVPLFLCVFWTLPQVIFPMWPTKFWRCLKRCYKFIRKRILVCQKYYNPDLWEIDRHTLMLFAMATGKSKSVIKYRFVKSVYEYIG